MVLALAPEGVSAADANRRFNDFVGDPTLPLAVFHDHFLGRPGGMAIFYVATPDERDALLDQEHLAGWAVEVRPMVFSYSPAAFDEQIAFTLKAYRGKDWSKLRLDRRPRYGNAAQEAESAEETDPST